MKLNEQTHPLTDSMVFINIKQSHINEKGDAVFNVTTDDSLSCIGSYHAQTTNHLTLIKDFGETLVCPTCKQTIKMFS